MKQRPGRRGCKLYVEGGGDGNAALRSEAREAFSVLLHRAGVTARPRVVLCGGRREAYDRFCTALEHGEDAYLLVDAEDPVAEPPTIADDGAVTGADPWRHLEQRRADGWSRPAGALDAQLHLMTVVMETWLLTDRDAVRTAFGSGLVEARLPDPSARLESMTKSRIYEGLKAATKDAKGGPYGKGSHSFRILKAVSPERLRVLPWARRFLDAMQRLGR